jgi:hypothetical protein
LAISSQSANVSFTLRITTSISDLHLEYVIACLSWSSFEIDILEKGDIQRESGRKVAAEKAEGNWSA